MLNSYTKTSVQSIVQIPSLPLIFRNLPTQNGHFLKKFCYFLMTGFTFQMFPIFDFVYWRTNMIIRSWDNSVRTSLWSWSGGNTSGPIWGPSLRTAAIPVLLAEDRRPLATNCMDSLSNFQFHPAHGTQSPWTPLNIFHYLLVLLLFWSLSTD